MNFEEVKSAVMNLSEKDQKRFLIEVVPAIWPKACIDDACVARVKDLVDDAVIKQYREQHMGSI